jgi:hypothetical protein
MSLNAQRFIHFVVSRNVRLSATERRHKDNERNCLNIDINLFKIFWKVMLSMVPRYWQPCERKAPFSLRNSSFTYFVLSVLKLSVTKEMTKYIYCSSFTNV